MIPLFTLRSLSHLTLLVALSCLFNPTLQNELIAQDQGQAKAKLNEKLETAIGRGEIEIQLKPMVPTERNYGVGWTPKAGTINLSESDKGLSGSLAIGEYEPFKFMLEFDDPETTDGSARLKFDLNCWTSSSRFLV